MIQASSPPGSTKSSYCVVFTILLTIKLQSEWFSWLWHICQSYLNYQHRHHHDNFLMSMKVLMMIWNIMTMMIHCAIIVWYCRSSCRRIVWYSFSVQYILLLMRWPWGNDEKDQYHDIVLLRMEHWDGLVFPLSALHALHNLHNCSDNLSCKIFHCLMTISNHFTFHIYLDF